MNLVKSKDVTFLEGSNIPDSPDQDTDHSPDNQDNVTTTPVNDHISAPRHPPGPIVTPRRSTRVGRPTEKAKALAGESAFHSQTQRVVHNIPIPRHINEALNSPHCQQWQEACAYELGKLLQHDVWTEVPRPVNAHVIKGMWVFNVKVEIDGSSTFRARWVARGDTQIEGEFTKIRANAGDFTVARYILAMAAALNGDLIAADINSAYLHSPLDDVNPIYVEYPTGMSPKSGPDKVCLLKKALYGLKQGARAWQDKFSSTMALQGYTRASCAPTAFVKSTDSGRCLVATHVDDCTVACISNDTRSSIVDIFRSDLSTHYQFSEKDLTSPAKVLGFTVQQDKQLGTIRLTVEKKIDDMVQRYHLTDALIAPTPMVENALSILGDANKNDASSMDKPSFPFSQLIGELLWISTNARPDICYATQILAKYLQKPLPIHCDMAKRIVRYLKGTRMLGLQYSISEDLPLPTAYADSDFAREITARKSYSGHVILLAGSPVEWKVKRQDVVALSTAEAEYLSASLCARTLLFFRHLFLETMQDLSGTPSQLFVDNIAAVKLCSDAMYHGRTKHIDIPAHHIRDCVNSGQIIVSHISGSLNPADILTKPLNTAAHMKCVALLGMC